MAPLLIFCPQEETFQSRRAVRIFMPDRLKSLLVDDWENITKNLQLVQLPSGKPAGVILDEYFAYAAAPGMRNSVETDILEEVIQGLKEYFNKSLGRLLLYRFEREQLYDICTDMENATSDLAGKTLADIYGGEHLLRLFGQLAAAILSSCVQYANSLQFPCPSSLRRPTWTHKPSTAFEKSLAR